MLINAYSCNLFIYRDFNKQFLRKPDSKPHLRLLRSLPIGKAAERER